MITFQRDVRDCNISCLTESDKSRGGGVGLTTKIKGVVWPRDDQNPLFVLLTSSGTPDDGHGQAWPRLPEHQGADVDCARKRQRSYTPLDISLHHVRQVSQKVLLFCSAEHPHGVLNYLVWKQLLSGLDCAYVHCAPLPAEPMQQQVSEQS